MENEEKLLMMKMAGFEVVDKPEGAKTRRFDVYKGHTVIEGMTYPAEHYNSALDLLFGFYLIGTFDEKAKYAAAQEMQKQAHASQMIIGGGGGGSHGQMNAQQANQNVQAHQTAHLNAAQNMMAQQYASGGCCQPPEASRVHKLMKAFGMSDDTIKACLK